MTTDRVAMVSPGNFLLAADYEPDTPGQVVADNFKGLIDVALSRLVAREDGRGKKTDVNYRYQTRSGEMIKRWTHVERPGLKTGIARILDDEVTLTGVGIGGPFSRVELGRRLREYRARGGPRRQQGVSWEAAVYLPHDKNPHLRFEYDATRRRYIAQVVPDDYDTMGKVTLYDKQKGDGLTLADTGLSADVINRLDLTLKAAAFACYQDFESMPSPHNPHRNRDLLDDPHDAERGFGGYLADLVLTR